MHSCGYAAAQRQTLSGRDLEREVLTRITARLAAADPDLPGGNTALFEALEDNRRLWCALAVDLAQPANFCPPALKASLLSLAAFVERQTSLVRDGGGDKAILVEINRNVASGLSMRTAEAA
ncbi:flagellar biosynthesis regulator FlaF [Parvularcula oceani]|uniref:flagellar biosynthesis regulator FlaF n=1 Tax=Parvularcula oceani TaxID=1247963 RepID=UPI0004E1B702|nr:flagellar biosynthesis regulator FlaF [Parvularcula oceani]